MEMFEYFTLPQKDITVKSAPKTDGRYEDIRVCHRNQIKQKRPQSRKRLFLVV